jgi:hypothetical protein
MKLLVQVSLAAMIVALTTAAVLAESGTPAGAEGQVEAPGGKMGVPTPLPPGAPAVSTTTLPGLNPGTGPGRIGGKPPPAEPHGRGPN